MGPFYQKVQREVYLESNKRQACIRISETETRINDSDYVKFTQLLRYVGKTVAEEERTEIFEGFEARY